MTHRSPPPRGPRVSALLASLLAVVAPGCDTSTSDDPMDPAGPSGGKFDDVDGDPGEVCLQTGGRWIDANSPAPWCLCPDDREPEDGNCDAEPSEAEQACGATGGVWTGSTCACPGDFSAEDGNCLAGDPQVEHACYVTGGEWTDDSSDAYYCRCMDGSEPADGWCTDIQQACEATGGNWTDDSADAYYCLCPSGTVPPDGNCLASDPEREANCIGSGGTWTDDSSDAYYCVCPDGSEVSGEFPCP